MSKEMTKEEILEHNKKINEEASEIQQQINELYKQYNKKLAEIIPPCNHCPYDGVFRCEACSERNYEGFNIRNYPD